MRVRIPTGFKQRPAEGVSARHRSAAGARQSIVGNFQNRCSGFGRSERAQQQQHRDGGHPQSGDDARGWGGATHCADATAVAIPPASSLSLSLSGSCCLLHRRFDTRGRHPALYPTQEILYDYTIMCGGVVEPSAGAELVTESGTLDMCLYARRGVSRTTRRRESIWLHTGGELISQGGDRHET